MKKKRNIMCLELQKKRKKANLKIVKIRIREEAGS